MMLLHSANRSQRFRGFKVKHVIRAMAVLAVCIWLVYEIKGSGDSPKPEPEIRVTMEDGESKLHFGPKEMVDLDNNAARLSMEIEKPQAGSEADQWQASLPAKSEIGEGGGDVEIVQDREEAGNGDAKDLKHKGAIMEKQFSGSGDQGIEEVQFEQQSNIETPEVTSEDAKDLKDKEETIENETVGRGDQGTEEILGQFEQQSNVETPEVTHEDAKDLKDKEEAIENETVGHGDQGTEENLGQFEQQNSTVILSLEGENEKWMTDVIDIPNKMNDKVEQEDTENTNGEEDVVRELFSEEFSQNSQTWNQNTVEQEDTSKRNVEEDDGRESASEQFSQNGQTGNHHTLGQEYASQLNLEVDDANESASEEFSQTSQTEDSDILGQEDASKFEEDDASESVSEELSQNSQAENHDTMGQGNVNIVNSEENDVIESMRERISDQSNQKQDIALELSDSDGETRTFYDEDGPRDSDSFSLPLNKTRSNGATDILQHDSPVTADSEVQTKVDSTTSTIEVSEIDQIPQTDDANASDGRLSLQNSI
ncbi:uncharacterized protein LOC116245630 [Nymphaea colorata]|uniref:uncharacterized protein LOC116245630 n=1 Tax=Nymphaea colorata TaxID=210225 RepID=UPI00129E005A|nr:uncharacterized protein LOC116245630 [Nymphaea colorata]